MTNDAIEAVSDRVHFGVAAGRAINQGRRFIYYVGDGWVDLQHAVSAATTPGATSGLGFVFGYVYELLQLAGDRGSASEPEDIRSNLLGALSAHCSSVNDTSVGDAYWHVTMRLGLIPLSQEAAIEHLVKTKEQ